MILFDTAFSPSQLGAVKTLVTHANCPDGVATALLVCDALPSVDICFVQYDTKEHRELVAEPGLLFCDFSPPRERVAEFVEAGALVLDHHESARSIVESFGGNGVFGENEKLQCGAYLAFQHVWFPTVLASFPLCSLDDTERIQTAATVALLAAIRDTWRSKDPQWEAALMLAELQMFWRLDQPLSYYSLRRQDERAVLAEKLFVDKMRAAETAIKNSFRFCSDRGTRVLLFQGVKETGEAAEILDSQQDLVVGFYYFVDEGVSKVKYSLRSHTGFDCRAMAEHFGGGGHKAAASFAVSDPKDSTPWGLFFRLLAKWEWVE